MSGIKSCSESIIREVVHNAFVAVGVGSKNLNIHLAAAHLSTDVDRRCGDNYCNHSRYLNKTVYKVHMLYLGWIEIVSHLFLTVGRNDVKCD